MNLLLMTVGAFLLLQVSAQGNNREACEKLLPSSIKKPCDLGENIDEMAPCVHNGTEVNDFESCSKLTSTCCWRRPKVPFLRKCFSKPKKCYVDLRLEKCYARRGVYGYDGIFTGYSTNGSYCFVPSVPYSKLLNNKEKLGFEIFNSSSRCLAEWKYQVEKQDEEKCEIRVSKNTTQALPGDLYFNKACIDQRRRPFYFEEFGKIESDCVCTADAWLEPDNDENPVSNEIKEYVQREEIISTCKQVLGMLTRRSWLNRLSLVSRNEVEEVMKALSNLTDVKKGRQLTKFDVELLLKNSRKVAQYPFFDVTDKDSAKDLMKNMTSVMSNLIEAVAIPVHSPGLNEAEGREVVPAKTLNQITETEESLKTRQELFQTLDAMSKAIGSRITSLKNHSEMTLKAVEDRVYLSMVVARANESRRLLKMSHFSDPNNHESDFVTVLDVKTKELEQKDPNSTGLALVTIFYDYPTNPGEKRVSKYLSVNVNEFEEGEPTKLSVPVNFTLTHASLENFDKSMAPTCSFLGRNTTREDWKVYGCITQNLPNSNKTSCQCNHTTHFAVLMKFTESQLPESHSEALKVISLVLGLISIASLSMTFLVFVYYRKTLIKDRMKIHFHLIVASLCGYISLLASSPFTSPPGEVISIPCVISAILTHFFYLAVFFWSLVEGVYLFYKIVLVFRHEAAEHICSYSPVIGWVFPFTIVALSFTLSQTVLNTESEKNSYADPATCFLSINGMIWAYAGPVFVVLTVNLLILFKVMYVIFKSSYTSIKLNASNASTRVSESLKHSSKGALLLMPILGIPTIVSLLYNLYTNRSGNLEDKFRVVAGTTGAYLQVILEGIRGILIFLLYCFYNNEVRAAHNLSTRRRKSVGVLEASQGKTRKHSRLPLLGGNDKNSTSDCKELQDITKHYAENGKGSFTNAGILVCSGPASEDAERGTL